jgi:hypothetical protein
MRHSTSCSAAARRLLVTGLLGWAVPTAPASADAMVLSRATLDWTGFSFSVSGSLTIDSIDYSSRWSSSDAHTTFGEWDHTSSSDGDVTASSGYAVGSGAATAEASVGNGFLRSDSVAVTSGELPNSNEASSSVFSSSGFWLYGHGAGSLTVSVPYELSVQLLEDDSATGLAANQHGEGSASVSLQLGPGAGWYAFDALSYAEGGPFGDGSSAKQGLLVLSRDFVEPWYGPLVFIGASASTEAVATVPEPPTLVLMTIGLIASTRWFRPDGRMNVRPRSSSFGDS